MRLDVEGPVLATALGKIPIQVVAKPLRDFGLGSHEIPDAVIFGGNANRRLYWPKEAERSRPSIGVTKMLCGIAREGMMFTDYFPRRSTPLQRHADISWQSAGKVDDLGS